MTNLRKLPSGDAVINTETGETVKCDLDAPQNRRAWMAWAATLPPLEPVELSAQRERMPAGLVRRAQVWASWFASNGAETHPEDSSSIVCDLAACEPAAMLTVEAAVRVVHNVKRVIVRGTPIPNTVNTFNVEEALRKAVKS